MAMFSPAPPTAARTGRGSTPPCRRSRPSFALLDRSLEPTGHLAGEAFTLADANLLPILYYLAKLPEAGAMIAASPALSGYLARHLARPSVAASEPPPPRRG